MKLSIRSGLTTIHHGGATSPLQMDEDDACRALLAHGDLLAACKALLARCKDALAIRVKLTGLTGGKLAEEIAQAEAAISRAEDT